MANLKASKQDIKRNKRNYDRNKHLKTLLKSALKRAYSVLEKPDDSTQSTVFSTCKLLDQSVSKGILKKNTAARKKSRLVKAYNLAIAK